MPKVKATNGERKKPSLVYVASRISPETKRKLDQIAARSKRKISAEIDFALVQYTASEP